MNNRLESLKNRETDLRQREANRVEELGDFLSIGQHLASGREGRKFFLLAKKLFYDDNERMLDNFFRLSSPDALHLARLSGEDYILRRVILQFLNGGVPSADMDGEVP